MSIIPDNVLQLINNLVPAAVRNDITSFTLYDNHPRDTNFLDIIVCTKTRELKEFYNRDLISTIYLDTISLPTKVNIFRNKKADLYYLVFAGSDLLILSKIDKLKLHKKIINVEKYDLEDITFRGYAILKVLCFDDAVPLVFDENLEPLQDSLFSQNSTSSEDALPIITQLQRKLTEAKYSIKCNEKTYNELLNIRHLASYSLYEKCNTNINDSLNKSDLQENIETLKVTSNKPWIKTCNGKIVIVFNIVNRNNVTLDDIQVLLNSNLQTSLVYTTKLFININIPPLWREDEKQRVQPNSSSAITVVMDMSEFNNNTLCKIELNGFIFFNKMGEKQLLPIDEIVLSSSDIMKEEFNILDNTNLEDPNKILALLATTKRTDITLRNIKPREDLNESLVELFCTFLQMESIPNLNNCIVHRISQYHTLHGIMIIFPENYTNDVVTCVISLHTRIESQVLAFIHYVYNDVLAKIIMTPSTYIMTAKIEELSSFNESLSEEHEPCLNYYEYASSVLNRQDTVLKYLDDTIIKMNESKSPTVQSKVGKEIDVFSGGFELYSKFRDKMLKEGAKGIERLINTEKFDSMLFE